MYYEIMREVSGLTPAYLAGVVRGYSRRAVRGEYYPGLVSEDAAHVDGIVYFGISASAWERLDRFEGNMYCQRLVPVELNDGSRTDAITYVFRPEFRRLLSEKEWDYVKFLRHGMMRFKCQYSGYNNL
jgi:hypothetical protein